MSSRRPPIIATAIVALLAAMPLAAAPAASAASPAPGPDYARAYAIGEERFYHLR